MKKFLLLILIAVMGSNLYVNASDADLFTYNRGSVDQIVSDLAPVDNYINANPDATFADVMSLGLLDINGANSNMSILGLSEPPAGIPSFLWGCVLGPIGLALVYIMTDQDKVETKKALWGCVTSTVLSVAFYFIYWGAVFSSL